MIAALNLFNVVASDVASDYIQAMVIEKVYKIAGQEFGPWQRKDINYCQGTLWIKIFKFYVASEIL